ncbi:MAG: penicillin-binding transpeptidase domain-containing protein, partial [Polyangiaceae bacterium]
FDRAAKKFGFDDDTPTAQLRRRPFSPAGATSPVTIRSEEGHGAVGDGLVTTPLQMIGAYAVFANGGEYIAPAIVRAIREPGGRVTWRNPGTRVPAIRAKTASAMLELLESAVDGPRATGKAARIAGVRVAGKTGTSQLHNPSASQVYASFIGIVPADAPRYVILVGVVDPGDGAWGGTVAAPAFARIATRALSVPVAPAAP